jgi:pimeloyl-ACP methyl ester carboxylesterase
LETQVIATTQLESEDAFVEVDGARVHYVHAGAGRPLVLIHGLVGSASNWRRNIAALARDASVYAIDLVNMGQSQRIADLDPSLTATADRVASWMAALGLTDADIVGHSHGGAVAQLLAARHPERVRSLTLFAPINPFNTLDNWMIRLYSSAPGRQLARVAPFLPQWVQRIALGRMYGDPARVSHGTLEGYVAGLRVPGTVGHVMSIVRGWAADKATLTATLPQIAHIPTLLMWGDRDRAVSVDSGRKLHRQLSCAELIVVPGGGHVLFEEMPEECDRTLCSWLLRSHIDGSRNRQPHLPGGHSTPAARTPRSSSLQQMSMSKGAQGI